MKNSQDNSDILFDENEGIGIITLNRAAELNTFKEKDYTRIHKLLSAAKASTSLRTLVLTGKGSVFSAGQDLSELNGSTITNTNTQRSRLEMLQDTTRLMASLEIPTIAAFNGYAVGFGIELALACDIRIATENSFFMFPECKRGLLQTNGVLWLLPRLIGMSHAKEILLSGNKVSAERALQMGLISAIYNQDDLFEKTMAMANRLANNSSESITLVKQYLNKTYDVSLETMLKLEAQGFITVMEGRDFTEGVTAFLEKRSPDYRQPDKKPG